MMDFVDLQVNGCYGVDFNSDDLTAEQLLVACKRLAADFVAGILATIITDDLGRMADRLNRLARLREQDPLAQQIIRGIHVEGPFISAEPGYVGAHPRQHVRPADLDAMKRLLDAGQGLVRLVTLAPECDPDMKLTRYLTGHGILVSAGHCDPSLDQLRAAIDAGLSLFTHLGNGCPLMLPRHDNVIQRVLGLSERLTICFIADGVHVPYTALGNYLRITSIERTIFVTDSISAAGLGPGRFPLGDQWVEVDAEGATWSSDRSHLVGSAVTMPVMAARAQAALRLTPTEIERLVSDNPRKLLMR
ncbi:MAG TPA: N-acetylglucosamine-6-phosphate deacetylase [Pirellulales bacterium]|jgi:N-acetylglucosamine-6-phosphate deacetylase|nr:N-acetylglucosamine-6-phosphate deacetylase [Pirellulales bacterium]